MRFLFFLLGLMFCSPVFSQQTGAIKTGVFSKNTIAQKYYKGKITEGKQWTDKTGENIVILTQNELHNTKPDANGVEGKTELYGYQFLKTDTGWKQVWRLYDQVEWCGLDVRSEFLKNSFTLTDLDKDGNAESSVAYALSCKGDISPDGLKFVLYEEGKKYIIRGSTTIVTNKQKQAGEKIIDKSFTDGPKAFLNFANTQWSKFSIQRY